MILWNSNQIEKFEGDRKDIIIVFKNIKVSDYYRIKSLNFKFLTIVILINPDLDEVKK